MFNLWTGKPKPAEVIKQVSQSTLNLPSLDRYLDAEQVREANRQKAGKP